MKEKNRKIWQGIKSVMLVITVVFVFVAVTTSIAMSGKNSVSELLPVQWTVFKHMDDGRQSNIVTTDISEAISEKMMVEQDLLQRQKFQTAVRMVLCCRCV